MSADNPRPEGDWRWRRVFVYVARLSLLLLLAFCIHRAPEAAMQAIALALVALAALESTFYLIAPSATELIRLVAELRPGIKLPGPGPQRFDGRL